MKPGKVARLPPDVVDLIRHRAKPLESIGEILARLLKSEIVKMKKEKQK